MNIFKKFPVGCFTFIMGSLMLLIYGLNIMMFLVVLGFSLQGALFFDVLGLGFLRSDYDFEERKKQLKNTEGE